MAITGNTRLVGIFGYPIKHTFSPPMHNAAFDALEMDYVYLPFEVKPEHLKQALRALPALGIVGVNLTIPHKEQALQYLDEVRASAKTIGAVNTVRVEGDKLIGYNTDGQGFVESLRQEGVTPTGKKVCMLGAGGSARAVAVALAMAGIKELTILNRTVERAQVLADHLASHFPEVDVTAHTFAEQEIIKQADIIINTTSVGMKPDDDLLINPENIQSAVFVADLIYAPAETKLLAAAKKRGAGTMNGLGMLVYQGALAFKLWTGQDAPVDVMKKALKLPVK